MYLARDNFLKLKLKTIKRANILSVAAETILYCPNAAEEREAKAQCQ